MPTEHEILYGREGECYYCRKNPATEEVVANPHTKEIHPTCEVCAYRFKLLKDDLFKYRWIKSLSWLALPLGAYVWRLYGWVGILIGVGFFFGFRIAYHSTIGAGSRVKREKAEAQFASDRDLFSHYRIDAEGYEKQKKTARPHTEQDQADPRVANQKHLELGETVKRLIDQQMEANAQGKRIVNRLPEFVRMNMLKGDILNRLNEIDRDTQDIGTAVWEQIDAVDLSGPLGGVAKLFDAIQAEIPKSLLAQLELECRQEDAKSDKPSHVDLPALSDG